MRDEGKWENEKRKGRGMLMWGAVDMLENTKRFVKNFWGNDDF